MGHAHILRLEAEEPGDLGLRAPDALAAKAQMHARAVPFGKTAARLHRDDHAAAVDHVRAHDVGRALHGFGHGLAVAFRPVDGKVAGRLIMQIDVSACQGKLRGQVLDIEFDQFGRVTRLVVCFGHDQRDRLAHITHAALGKNGVLGIGRLAAVAVLHHRGAKPPGQTACVQIIRRQYEVNARRLARLGHVEPGDPAMRHRRPQHEGMQRPIGDDIVKIPAMTGDEPGILESLDRLALAELLHVASSPAVYRGP